MGDMLDLSGLSPDQLATALEGPALPPPNGTASDFDHPRMTMPWPTACLPRVWPSILSCWCFVSMRGSSLPGGCISKTAFIVAFIGCGYFQLHEVGFFVHQWDVRIREMMVLLHNYIIFSNFQLLSVGLLKVAIILDWIRLFCPTGTRGSFFWACHAVMWINILWTASMIVAINLSCIPHQAIWDLTIPGKCFEKSTLDVALAVMALVTDLAILALPHRVIWRLHLSTKKKLGISAMFGLGLLSSLAAAARLPTVVNFAYNSSLDVVYDYSAVIFWALSEYTSGMLVFCVPSVPKIFGHVRRSGVVASLKSWAGSAPDPRGGENGSSQSRSRGHHSSGHAPHSRPRMYQQLDPHSGEIPLTDLSPAGSEERARHPLPPEEGTILRTTEFSTTEDSASNMPKSYHNRHHPWMEP
ncbi:uncharacterized protein PG998_004608 [Apiospora kogelbergensis]|uniref:uncharacterized protein n=1 Tax=Apiospora kogelbergensis TaxID=1337665 RepID=UPI0031324DE0